MNRLCILWIFIVAGGCGKSKTIITNNPSADSVYKNVFTVQAGWDIYTGGVYRYGPSIIENNDGTIDAWFAAPGGTFGDKILLFQDAGAQSPVSLATGNTAAQKFTATDSFYAVAVACPNWGSTNSNVTLSFYQWKSNYASTVAAAPLQQIVYNNYKDNQNLQVVNENKFPAGTYLWLLSDPSGTAGVWKKDGSVEGVSNFKDGAAADGCYQSFILINKSSGAAYWDQVAYRRSTDGGKTWTGDSMVLKPTEGTRDQFSICDPGVVKINNYYYIGYTSTEDERGVFNHAYVARSISPKGPWEKWNGVSWGGNPQPVITFDGEPDAWGAGEPCMVVNNDTLFFYYSWNGTTTTETRVAIASATDTNWPAHLTLHGTAVNKTSIAGSDHCDIKYRDDLKKYYAIHTASRLTANSYIVLWESSDGITFTRLADITTSLKPYLHNCGWSGDENGHIHPQKQQYISYAYGPNWANWNTMWHPISFKH
ncbi:MAG: hypothetical protein QM802_11075 [Agriterribacter sp.]